MKYILGQVNHLLHTVTLILACLLPIKFKGQFNILLITFRAPHGQMHPYINELIHNYHVSDGCSVLAGGSSVQDKRRLCVQGICSKYGAKSSYPQK